MIFVTNTPCTDRFKLLRGYGEGLRTIRSNQRTLIRVSIPIVGLLFAVNTCSRKTLVTLECLIVSLR